MFRAVVLLIFCNSYLVSQSIPDHEFEWSTALNCLPDTECLEIFLKAETDPKIRLITEDEFRNLISEAIAASQFPRAASGYIKIKLLFLIGKSVCINKIGVKGMSIEPHQINALSHLFRTLHKIEYEIHQGLQRNCQGLVYLTVRDGRLEDIRTINFGFRE